MHCMFDQWGLGSARPTALHAGRCRSHLVLALLRWQLAQLLRVAKDHVEMLVEGHEPAASRHIISQAYGGRMLECVRPCARHVGPSIRHFIQAGARLAWPGYDAPCNAAHGAQRCSLS